MAKHAQRTKVVLGGRDISNIVGGCSLPRYPETGETVKLELFIDRLEVDDDGMLIIHIDTAEGA